MLQVVSAAQMRECENYQIYQKNTPASELMQRAAEAAAEELLDGSFDISRILILCGNGNNGGDGLAMARILRCGGYTCAVRMAEPQKALSVEAQRQYAAAQAEGVCFDGNTPLSQFTVLVDALFGIGLARELSGSYLRLTEEMNASGIPVLSLDIPSGVYADDGRVMGSAVCASKTVTFAFLKPGLLLYPGAACAGRVVVKDIGISGGGLAPLSAFAYEKKDLINLPARPADANKGTFGKVLVVAGAKNMAGAAYLSAKAAYRVGAGLVKICTAEENRVILQTLLPEAVLMTYGASPAEALAEQVRLADVIAVGPGLGQSEEAYQIVKCVLHEARGAVVADADALNLAAVMKRNGETPFIRKNPLIITPHPGEMSRLTNKSIREVTENLLPAAIEFALENQLICVMKNARSVITDGKRVCINRSGNSGMAKGGSGDVLTGVIAGLLAQGAEPFAAASLGAYIHGLAGDAAALRYGSRSFLAGELADSVSDVISEV